MSAAITLPAEFLTTEPVCALSVKPVHGTFGGYFCYADENKTLSMTPRIKKKQGGEVSPPTASAGNKTQAKGAVCSCGCGFLCYLSAGEARAVLAGKD